jgi:hypothetical protein
MKFNTENTLLKNQINFLKKFSSLFIKSLRDARNIKFDYINIFILQTVPCNYVSLKLFDKIVSTVAEMICQIRWKDDNKSQAGKDSEHGHDHAPFQGATLTSEDPKDFSQKND